MIGDLVMLSPSLRALKDAYPRCKLTLLAQPFAREIFKVGLVDDFILYDKRGMDRGVRGFMKVVKQIRRNRFDCAFLFHKSYGSALLAMLARIPIRVGYKSELRQGLLTHAVDLSTNQEHIVYENLRLLKEFGIPSSTVKLEVFPDFSFSEHLFSQFLPSLLNGRDTPMIIICPHGGWKSKSWPISHINRFVDLFPVHSVTFVLVGAPGEEEYASHIYSVNNNLINLVGKTTLRELFCLIKRADLVLSPDTSVIHIAQALSTPVIALFGPTPPERCGPIPGANATVVTGEIKCQSLFMKECKKKPCCMETILPEAVKEIADAYLARVKRQPVATSYAT